MDTSHPLQPQVIGLTDSWLVVSKPAGWLTIPGRESKSLAPILSEWAKQEHGPTWVVHRLDRETSGVVLLARSAASHREANLWFQTRKVRKLYHCLASGVPPAPVFKVKDAIAGAPSVTQVEVKATFSQGFLARVFPLTGRRHQIRIHLASKGYPIFGDSRYGGAIELQLNLGQEILTFSRVALHASRLELPTGDVFEAPFPEDLSQWLQKLKLGNPL